MDLARRQLLEDCFFENTPFPADMTAEDRQYILLLSGKWDRALLDLYRRLTQEDNDHHREAERSPDKANDS